MPTMKAPYRVLFTNDSNAETCVSPYRPKGQPYSLEWLKASVDETAGTGIQAHFIQPGEGRIPNWRSRSYPIEEHLAFYKDRFDIEPRPGSREACLAGGADLVREFVARCGQHDLAPFVSLRLNDGHGLEDAGKGTHWALATCPRFYVEHPEYRIGPEPENWEQRVLNWKIPEVRDEKFRFIEELCEQYDIAGFELDFMRHCSFFQVDRTSFDERVNVMTDFVARVRSLLDRTAPAGQHRWLCVRVPAHLHAHDALGIDLAAWVAAGVEMVNLSHYFFTEQCSDFAAVRQAIPDAAIYLEMCHTTRSGPLTSDESNYDNFSFRRTTPTQYYTTAHLAYARGLDGVSAFNFVYYREHGVGERGPFCEPPFHVFAHLGDPAWLAQQPQHYFLSDVWDSPCVPGRPLPVDLEPGQQASFSINMAPPAGGWQDAGRLRIQSLSDLGSSVWRATLNGVELNETQDRSEPYGNPYPALLGKAAQHRAWLVPPGLPRDGDNPIVIAFERGPGPATLVFLDLATTLPMQDRMRGTVPVDSCL